MVRKVLLAGVAGGTALAIWGIVVWMLLPIYQPVLRGLPGEDGVAAALIHSGAGRGIYVLPALPYPPKANPASQEIEEQAWSEKSKRGPVALLIYRPDGRNPERPLVPMMRSWIFCTLAATFTGWALARARIGWHTGRVIFVLALGMMGWLLGPAQQWNWLGFPTDYTIATFLDNLGGWTIVGIVQTGLVGTWRGLGARRRPAAAPPA